MSVLKAKLLHRDLKSFQLTGSRAGPTASHSRCSSNCPPSSKIHLGNLSPAYLAQFTSLFLRFSSNPVLLQLTVLRSKQLTSKIIFQNKPICKLQLFWKKCYFISGKRINVGESAPNISASQSTEFNNGHIVGT